jgi:hypothetical protein
VEPEYPDDELVAETPNEYDPPEADDGLVNAKAVEALEPGLMVITGLAKLAVQPAGGEA